jgi:very-short-patch-repair endonuclease
MTEHPSTEPKQRHPAVVILGSGQPVRAYPGASGTVDAKAATLARAQHGRTTRRQLHAVGISPRTIHRRITAGGWAALHGGVIDLGTHERSWAQDLTATLLAAGGDRGHAWASHQTAGRLYDLLDIDAPRRHHVIVPRAHRPTVPTAVLHRTRSLPADERSVVAGFPVTTIARTLLDLASSMAPAQLEPLLWDACRHADDLPVDLARLLQRYPHRHGRPMLSRLLSDVHPQVAAAESPLEVYGLLALRDPLLPDPVLQYRVRDRHGRIVARLDAAWPDHRAGLEFDGARYHDSPSRRARDAHRRQHVRELGWSVIVVRAHDLAGSRLRALKADLHRLLGVS